MGKVVFAGIGGLRTGVLSIAVAAGLLLLTAPVALGGTGNFTVAGTSPEAAGHLPNSVTAGDFNGDGKQDLATANYGSDDLTILLGDGTGNFTPAATSPEAAGDRPVEVVVGDFNGDGKQDLANVNQYSDDVTVLLGDGTGNFTPAASSPEAAGHQPRSLAVGDFNGDGKQDLATANFLSYNVTVLLGDGTGNFTAAATSPEPVGFNPTSIAVGDFNGDGKQDLATTNRDDGDVSILLGDGTGNFTAAATRPETGTFPQSIAVGDFNGDGKQDLATANGASDDATILLGNGGGNFTPAAGSPEPAGHTPFAVEVGDFNRDGRQDLVIVNDSPNAVTILLGDGTGNFTPAATSPEPVGDFPFAVAVGDFNGDAKQDLATANLGSDDVTILLADDPTVAADDTETVSENAGETMIDVRANDIDVDSAKEKIASVTQPANGTAALTRDGSQLRYRPDQGYCNSQRRGVPDTFRYTLAGGSEATVAVTVACDAPRLTIKHPHVPLVRGRVVLRLVCKGAGGLRCAGVLRLRATSLKRRPTESAAASRKRFSIATGATKEVRLKPDRALRAILRRRGKAVAEVIATMRGDGAAREAIKRPITVQVRG